MQYQRMRTGTTYKGTNVEQEDNIQLTADDPHTYIGNDECLLLREAT